MRVAWSSVLFVHSMLEKRLIPQPQCSPFFPRISNSPAMTSRAHETDVRATSCDHASRDQSARVWCSLHAWLSTRVRSMPGFRRATSRSRIDNCKAFSAALNRQLLHTLFSTIRNPPAAQHLSTIDEQRKSRRRQQKRRNS